jgi:hypothetical protein
MALDLTAITDVIVWGFGALSSLITEFASILPDIVYILLYLATAGLIIKFYDRIMSWLDTAFKMKK